MSYELPDPARDEDAATNTRCGQKSRRDGTAAKPTEPMLQDEAVSWLFARLQAEPSSELRIEVDHGMYHAEFISGVTTFEGEELPNLTDALCALIGVMP